MTQDFLFVEFGEHHITGPLPYCKALRMLRFCISLVPNSPLTPDMINNFTLHSLKRAMLSWLAQLHMPPEDRAAQGHHTFVHSVQLYSRDDVHASLHAQQQVRSALDRGWVPTIPLARGSQTPLAFSSLNFSIEIWPDPPHHFRMLSMAAVPAPMHSAPTQQPDLAAPELPDPDRKDLPDFDSHDEAMWEFATADPYQCLSNPPGPRIRYLKATSVAHVAIKDAGSSTGYPAKCGALGSFELLEELPLSCRLCQRKACVGTFHHYE